MAQNQTDVQKARSVLAELIGSEQALADFEARQKQSPEFWRYMTKEYKKTQGLTDDAVSAEARSDTAVKGAAGPDGVAGDKDVTVSSTDNSHKAAEPNTQEGLASAAAAKKRGTIGQPSPHSQQAVRH